MDDDRPGTCVDINECQAGDGVTNYMQPKQLSS